VVADARRELLLRPVLADAERVRRWPVERFALAVLRALLRPVLARDDVDFELDDLRLVVAIF
jgi:hypothetical protein